MNKVELYFSLGSNLGDRKQNILSSIEKMEEYFSLDAIVSSIIETEPWGFECDQPFLNCAVRFDFPQCGISPFLHSHCILGFCKSIETWLGREVREPLYDNNGHRIYSSRPIDIDILLYGEEKILSSILTIPHPLMQERSFVMEPLLEIASPQIKQSFSGLFESWL